MLLLSFLPCQLDNRTRKVSNSLLFSPTGESHHYCLRKYAVLYKSTNAILDYDSFACMPSVNIKYTANITCGSRPLPSTLNLEQIVNLMGKLPRDTHAVVHPSQRIEDHEVASERGPLNGIIWVCGTQGLRISSSLDSQSPMPPAIACD